jgi:tRNA-specific 2-thiouridylase
MLKRPKTKKLAMKKKALLMLSGGLDSILAGKLILDQGIKLEAIHFVTPFCISTPKGSSLIASVKAAEFLGIKLKVATLKKEFLKIVQEPKHGYGAHLNPCIDCRILTLKKAKAYMNKIGASFIVTGEVLGERPMSQRRDAMNLIDKKSALKGLILRPLSAKCLEPTLPEKKGIVKREKLLDIKGRSRKPQLALAKKFALKDYLSPSGGCLLTDPGFSKRVEDLLKHDVLTLENIEPLKVGRHFRLSKNVKAIVGRNEEENKQILKLAKKDDVLIEMAQFPGPICLVRGKPKKEEIRIAASITARYSKGKQRARLTAAVWNKKNKKRKHIKVSPGIGRACRIGV